MMQIEVQLNKQVRYASGLCVFTLVQENRREAEFRIEAEGREGQIQVSFRGEGAAEALELGATYTLTLTKKDG